MPSPTRYHTRCPPYQVTAGVKGIPYRPNEKQYSTSTGLYTPTMAKVRSYVFGDDSEVDKMAQRTTEH